MFDDLMIQFKPDDLITHFEHIYPPESSLNLESSADNPNCSICVKLNRVAKSVVAINDIKNPKKKELK